MKREPRSARRASSYNAVAPSPYPNITIPSIICTRRRNTSTPRRCGMIQRHAQNVITAKINALSEVELGIGNRGGLRLTDQPFADQVERHVEHAGEEREHQLQIEQAVVRAGLVPGFLDDQIAGAGLVNHVQFNMSLSSRAWRRLTSICSLDSSSLKRMTKRSPNHG